jgi:hypothetical protein
LYGGALDPDKIVKIPVHECAGLNVTEEQESNVFNDIDYWRKMPVVRDAASYIGKIRNLGYKIHIFTHRPWPDSSHVSRDAFKTTREKWGRIRIKKITKVWLAENRIHCDVLEVERGNTYTIDNRSLSHNRFTIAAKEQFKVFVEDDVRKARKLANSCDVVFLIEHPYNIYTESDPKDPVNLRRVKGWKDIYDYMRELY